MFKGQQFVESKTCGGKNQLFDQIGLCLQHGLGEKGGLKNVSLKRGERGWGNSCSNKKREGGEIFPHPRLKVINLCLASLKALSSEKKSASKRARNQIKLERIFFTVMMLLNVVNIMDL